MESWRLREGSGSLVRPPVSTTDNAGPNLSRQTVCEFTAKFNVLLGIYDNLLNAVDVDDLCRAIGIARMVDQPAEEEEEDGGLDS